ncbi:hypothetical protein V1979_39445, partial [Pseudomonas aeruginosa]
LIWEAGPEALALIIMGLLLVWRHQANIKKLLAGTESKLGAKAAGATPAPGTSKKHPHGTGPKPAGHSHHHPSRKK